MTSKAAKAKGAERKQRMDTSSLMEQILSRDNLNAAYLQVVRNKGAAGVDGMTVEELGAYLSENGENIREQLRTRKYKPQPVRPKMLELLLWVNHSRSTPPLQVFV